EGYYNGSEHLRGRRSIYCPNEGPSFPLPVPGLPVPPIVIENLGTRLGNLEYKHGVVTRKMVEVSDAVVADIIAIEEIHPRVAIVREQVQVVEAQTVQVVSRLEEIEMRVQQVESRVDTQSSGQMAVHGHDVIVGSNEQSGRVGEPHGYRNAIHAVDGGAPYCFGKEAPRTASGTPVVFLFFLPCCPIQNYVDSCFKELGKPMWHLLEIKP
nr:hypothetical protein [Tanacetum cinerariifolium]